MRQRIITAAVIRRCAFAICKAAADCVSAVDRCAMQMSCHLFHARHSASHDSRSKRLSGALRGKLGRLQSATVAYSQAAYEPANQPATRPQVNAATRRPANTAAAWRVRPMQVVRVVAPASLG